MPLTSYWPSASASLAASALGSRNVASRRCFLDRTVALGPRKMNAGAQALEKYVISLRYLGATRNVRGMNCGRYAGRRRLGIGIASRDGRGKGTIAAPPHGRPVEVRPPARKYLRNAMFCWLRLSRGRERFRVPYSPSWPGLSHNCPVEDWAVSEEVPAERDVLLAQTLSEQGTPVPLLFIVMAGTSPRLSGWASSCR
jgi:hypothetical protein